MISLLAAALMGGVLMFGVLWPYGALPALFGAPFGASALAVVAGLLLALRKADALGEQEHSMRVVHEKTKEAA